MSATGLDAFDTTIQKTNTWLHELMQALGWQDKHRTYVALRATLHALRDRLPIEEVAHLGAQLPMLVRGIYYEGWDPRRRPPTRHREQFLVDIARGFRPDFRVDAEAVARGVFKLLASHVTPGEIDDVVQTLPAEVRQLWPRVRMSA